MKYFLLLLIPVFLFSCSDIPKNDKPVAAVSTREPAFREEVLTLMNAGLLKKFSSTDIDSLIKQYVSDSLNGLKEMLVHSGEMLKISAELNGRSPLDVYKVIFDTIAAHYPDLKTSEVKCEFLPEDWGGHDTGWTLVTMKIGDRKYEKVMYYLDSWPVDELVYKMFNTYLADISSDERLYLVQYECNDCNKDDDFMGTLDVRHFGYMRLKKAQADSIMHLDDLSMEPMDEFSIFTSARQEQVVNDFEKTGLISKGLMHWYQYKKTDLLRGSLYSMEDLYDFYDTLFCTASFDTINDFNPYKDILTYMAGISQGGFVPEGVSDQHANPVTHTVRFNMKGKVYEQEFEQHGEMYDPDVIDMVNAALADQKAGGKFYSVLTRDNICMLVYIRDDQFEKVKASGFFTDLEPGTPQKLKLRFAAMPNT